MPHSGRKPALRQGSDRFFAPLNVLVVDDMPAIRRMLRHMLQALGVRNQINESADGLEAWEALQDRFYDLVICDINMPNMNGLELLRRFRANPRYETTPFLMITGEVTEEIVAAAAESEVDGYLLKPFKINALESRLRIIILNKHQPSSGESLFLKARKLTAANRPQEALPLLEKLLNPPFKKQAKVLNLMGECYLALASFNLATSCFTQALELNPQYLKSYQNLASLSEKQGNLTEARRFLEQARSLSPLNPERLFRLGQLCLKTGDQQQAQQYLKESLKCGHAILEAEPSEVAEVFLQAGMDQVAEDLLTQSIQDQPDNVNLYNRLGIALRRQNKHQEALKCYQTALDLAPANEKVYFNLGILYFDLGNKEKALQAFQTALRLRPDFVEAQEYIELHLLYCPAPAGPDIDPS
jgi:CheY-like chemotaxis protein